MNRGAPSSSATPRAAPSTRTPDPPRRPIHTAYRSGPVDRQILSIPDDPEFLRQDAADTSEVPPPETPLFHRSKGGTALSDEAERSVASPTRPALLSHCAGHCRKGAHGMSRCVHADPFR